MHERVSKMQQPTHHQQSALNAMRSCRRHDRGSTCLLLQQQQLHRVRPQGSHKRSSAPGQRQHKQQVTQRHLWWWTISRLVIQLTVRSSSSSTSGSISSVSSATVRDGQRSAQLTLWRQQLQQWQQGRTARQLLAQGLTTCSGTASHRRTCTSTSTRYVAFQM